MSKKLVLSLLVVFLVSACTPARVQKVQAPRKNNKAKVTVVREKKLTYWGVLSVFGEETSGKKKDYAKIKNGRYTEFYVEPGEHMFYARSNQADRKNYQYVKLKNNEHACFVISPNKSLLWKSVVMTPFIYYFDSIFKFERVDCRTSPALYGKKAFKVNYERPARRTQPTTRYNRGMY